MYECDKSLYGVGSSLCFLNGSFSPVHSTERIQIYKSYKCSEENNKLCNVDGANGIGRVPKHNCFGRLSDQFQHQPVNYIKIDHAPNFVDTSVPHQHYTENR